MTRWDREPGAGTLIVGYGVTALAVREAVSLARAGDRAVSSLEVLSLWHRTGSTVGSGHREARR